ncbi:MAG: hypothetical protein ACJ768_06735 [Gaiellaceae bacterium]
MKTLATSVLPRVGAAAVAGRSRSWSFVGIGWQTTGDALLAQTSAALARERRRIAREEAVTA